MPAEFHTILPDFSKLPRLGCQGFRARHSCSQWNRRRTGTEGATAKRGEGRNFRASGDKPTPYPPTVPEGVKLSIASADLTADLRDVRGSMLPAPVVPSAAETSSAPSRASSRALDWFSFFLADIQTGFGPFVAVYLTAHAWTQVDIGLVLTAGGLVALVGQMPGGALVDAVRSARLAAGVSVVGDLRERARHRRMADLRHGDRRPRPARGRQLRARTGDRGDQPRACRPRGAGRAHRPQCALRIDRQCRCRRGDGRLRLSAVEPGRLPSHRHPGRARAAGIGADTNERRRAALGRQPHLGARAPTHRQQASAACCAIAGCSFSAPASSCSSSPMRPCSRSWAAS